MQYHHVRGIESYNHPKSFIALTTSRKPATFAPLSRDDIKSLNQSSSPSCNSDNCIEQKIDCCTLRKYVQNLWIYFILIDSRNATMSTGIAYCLLLADQSLFRTMSHLTSKPDNGLLREMIEVVTCCRLLKYCFMPI